MAAVQRIAAGTVVRRIAVEMAAGTAVGRTTAAAGAGTNVKRDNNYAHAHSWSAMMTGFIVLLNCSFICLSTVTAIAIHVYDIHSNYKFACSTSVFCFSDAAWCHPLENTKQFLGSC